MQYLATNLLLETLTLNLDGYEPGSKNIDTFTFTQIEELIGKLQQFLADCTLAAFDEDAQTRDKIMMYFYQQPNVVRCRMCGKCLNDYVAVLDHIKQHERQKVLDETKPFIRNFTKKNCIPRVNDKLSKSMRKFLSKNPNTLLDGAIAECIYVQNDIDNDRAREDLEECLKPHYPSVKCYPFGSRIVGTGAMSSDLDVFVDLNNVYYGKKDDTARTEEEKEEELTKSIEHVGSILRSTTQWNIDAAVLNARVPVLRIVSSNYDELHCDLTFSNGLAHRNSLLLQYMFGLQPSARQLVCYLKNWNRESCLNSYTLSLMVIYMYQCRKLLPSVAKLQEDSSNDVIIEGWNAGFATPTLEELNLELLVSSISDLAYMFFEFYSFQGKLFSVETQVVCPYLGNVRVTKCSFESPNYDAIPVQMGRLKHYLLQHQDDTNPKRLFAYHKPFVVQDPFEHSHNVAKAIPLLTIVQVRKESALQNFIFIPVPSHQWTTGYFIRMISVPDGGELRFP
uniref:C2H2-type domain-containing protein n=1 Tax=Anopheles culicifacies TaxID=139723 RepID=A0A182LU39_9DIPT